MKKLSKRKLEKIVMLVLGYSILILAIFTWVLILKE